MTVVAIGTRVPTAATRRSRSRCRTRGSGVATILAVDKELREASDHRLELEDGLRSIVNAELIVNRGEVGLDRPFGHVELALDQLVGHAATGEAQDGDLAGAEA